MKAITQLRRRLTLRHAGDLGEPQGRRARATLAAVIAGCMVITGVAVAGAGKASPGLKFARQGQWIYNSTLGKIFHVNGSTKNVDSQVPLAGAGPGTQIVETDENFYALARGRTFQFGQSDLQVLDPVPAPPDEQPVGLSGGGAAFAVYRNAGSIARLGQRPVIDKPGVPLGPPVVTSSGTLWVHRLDSGQLCQLPIDADRLTCPAKTPVGHSGALTLIGDDQVVFVDLTGRSLYAIDGGGLGKQAQLPLPALPADTVVAQNDVAGRIAIVTPEQNVLYLVDTAELRSGKTAAAPLRTELPEGRYERMASSGQSLALLDDRSGTLITVDREGNQRAKKQLAPPSRQAKLSPDDKSGLYRGADSRLYVANKSGEEVMVVDDTGEVTPVDTSKPEPASPKPTQPAEHPTTRPTQPPPVQPTTQPPSQPTTHPTTQPTRQPTHKQPPNPPPGRPSGEPTQRPSENHPPTQRPPTQRPPTQPPPTSKPDPKPTVQASRPGAPSNVSGKAGTGSALVNWGAAASNGAAITAYQVSWSGGTKKLGAGVRSTTITGLTNGTAYTFTVRATNRVGTGPGASTTRLTPDGGAPDAPGNFTAQPGSGKVAMSWSRPALHGGTLQGYDVAANVTSGGGTSKADTATTTRWTFTGLTNGATYRVTVQAVVKDAQGRLVLGKTASRTVKVGGGSSSGASLTASRGASTTHGSGERACNPPGCAYIKVVGKGLKPDTAYFFQPFTTRWQPSNTGATLTTESDGSIVLDDRFATDAPGQQVWVVATADGEPTLRSNKFTWSTP
ncbi:fibronectin type III domain-containing protein [Kribbella sp. NPDC051620]|uniref:fibronectin type III domain-containing protein n=1 Tax=Kribbella sp. NPDC051620 TaxID=3364120 RepID=UPI0037BAEC13